MFDDEQDDESIGENWMFEPALMPYAKLLRVKVQGTLPDNYLSGRYEGQTGTLDGLMRVPKDMDQTLRVIFDHETDGMGSRNVLAKYVVPLHPTARSQVVTPMTGQYKGEEWSVTTLDEECSLYSSKKGMFHGQKLEELVQLNKKA